LFCWGIQLVTYYNFIFSLLIVLLLDVSVGSMQAFVKISLQDENGYNDNGRCLDLIQNKLCIIALNGLMKSNDAISPPFA